MVLLDDPRRRRLRFLFPYRGQLRALAWMTVGGDGSLYLNPRRQRDKPLVVGRGINDGAGGYLDLEWQEPQPDSAAKPKVSYHASGVVKGGTHRSRSLNVRAIETPHTHSPRRARSPFPVHRRRARGDTQHR